MSDRKVWSIYFSPSGTTKAVVDRIAEGIGETRKPCNLLRDTGLGEKRFGGEDLAVVGMPVFAGRIPAVCAEALQNLEGEKTPAVAVVVYGNRDYEDALLELCDHLKEKGFCVIAAAAVVAQHSIFTEVAAGRPDNEDWTKLDVFVSGCRDALKRYENAPKEFLELTVKGNRPYREAGAVPLKPSGNSRCNRCGVCVSICPVHAISLDQPRRTDKEICISCTACITACPQHARAFRGPLYIAAVRKFRKKNSARKDPEFFL